MYTLYIHSQYVRCASSTPDIQYVVYVMVHAGQMPSLGFSALFLANVRTKEKYGVQEQQKMARIGIGYLG